MKVNKKANFWFGISLLLWASFWVDEIIILVKGVPLKGLGLKSLLYIQFFTPIVLFISVTYFTNPNYQFSKKSLLAFVLPIFYLVVIVMEDVINIGLKLVSIIFILTHTLGYTFLSYFKIRKHQLKIKSFASDTWEIDLKWLEYIMLTIVSIALIISVFNIIYFGLPLNLYMNIVMLFVVLFIAYNVLKQKEIFPVKASHRAQIIALEKAPVTQQKPIKRKLIEDDQLDAYKSKLQNFVTKKEVYLNSEINLAALAEAMDLSTHQLSYIINTGFNQNFFQFINGYRIEKAKVLLKDPNSEKLSILGIAFESGFSSKTAFNTTFKRITGQTPTQYKNDDS
jgi:AraC-like DNA-binding protein